MNGQDRDEVLTQLIQVLAMRAICSPKRGHEVSELWTIIQAADPELRNRSVDAFCREATTDQLLAQAAELEKLRRGER